MSRTTGESLFATAKQIYEAGVHAEPLGTARNATRTTSSQPQLCAQIFEDVLTDQSQVYNVELWYDNESRKRLQFNCPTRDDALHLLEALEQHTNNVKTLA